MLGWFKKDAPIRTKFDALTGAHTLLMGTSAVATYMAATGAGGQTPILVSVAALGTMFALDLLSKKLICDPYVTTVVRMEGLAAGDLTSPVLHMDHGDCVGRMTKAMEVFKDNAVKVQESGAAQQLIVTNLATGLKALANGDVGHRIDARFPEEYEQLRHDFNAAAASPLAAPAWPSWKPHSALRLPIGWRNGCDQRGYPADLHAGMRRRSGRCRSGLDRHSGWGSR